MDSSPFPAQLSALFTQQHLVWATAAWLLLQNAGRAYHAIVSGGGLFSIWRALIFGTNTPAPKETAVPVRNLALSLFLALGLAGLMVGCAGTPGRIAYNTVAAPAVTVDVAMTAWGDYVAQFHPPAATELKVKAAYELYQKTELVAIDAAQAYATLASSGSTNGLGEAQLYDMLSSQTSRNALNDLVNLLTSLGIKF